MTTGDKVIAYLLSRGFKQKNGEYNGNCPWRAGADSESFWVKIETDGEHGTWKDFSHDEGGSLYEFCERVGIETPRPTAQETKRAYNGLDDYAAAHYAPAEAFTRLGWFETEHHGRTALAIPTATGTRYRFTDGASGKPAFIHDAGYQSSWYRLKAAVDFAKSEGLPLVLCNGEASVAVGQWYRIPAAAVTSGSEHALKPAHLGELKALWEGGRVIVALDCDQRGKSGTEELSAQLMDAGFVVAVVDLAVGDKGDLCDFCGLHSGNERGVMWALLERAEFTAPTPQNAALQALKALAPMMTDLNAKLRHSKPSSPDVVKQLNQLKRQIEAIELGLPSNAMVSGEQVANTLTVALGQAQQNRGAIIGLRTGFPEIDRVTGGLQPGLYVLMGATGMGKTTLAASIAGFNVKMMGAHGVVMSTEMHPEEWALMAAAWMSGVNTADAMDGALSKDESARLMDAVNAIDTGLTFVHGSSPTIASLADTIAQARTARPVDYVVIDSASVIIDGMGGDVKEATSQTYKGLQDLAMKVRLPFIITHQIHGRAVAGRENKVANIYDGFGSSTIENYARGLITLYYHHWYVEQGLAQPDAQFPEGTAALRIVKLRMRRNSAKKLYIVDYKLGTGFYPREKR